MNRRNFLKGFLASGAVIALAPLMPIVEAPISTATFVTFDSLVATTLANYRSVIVERPSPVFEALKKNGWIAQGQPIVEPFIFN